MLYDFCQTVLFMSGNIDFYLLRNKLVICMPLFLYFLSPVLMVLRYLVTMAFYSNASSRWLYMEASLLFLISFFSISLSFAEGFFVLC